MEAGRYREQRQASMLRTHAALCRLALDGKLPEVWEAFPLWTQEEIDRMRVERIKANMMQRTKKGG